MNHLFSPISHSAQEFTGHNLHCTRTTCPPRGLHYAILHVICVFFTYFILSPVDGIRYHSILPHVLSLPFPLCDPMIRAPSKQWFVSPSLLPSPFHCFRLLSTIFSVIFFTYHLSQTLSSIHHAVINKCPPSGGRYLNKRVCLSYRYDRDMLLLRQD